MPNAIAARQNDEEMLELRAASSEVYREGTAISSFQTVLAASAAILGPTLALVDPSWKVWGALFGAAVLLIDAVLLEPAARKKKETGAKIQELFDTRLLDLPANRLKTGAPPDHEAIVGLANKYKARHPTLGYIRDWYPAAAGEVPLEYGRLICQRANMRWDSSLRHTYCWILIGGVVLLPIVGLATGIAAGWNLEHFTLSVAVPLLPAVLKLWGEYRKHLDTANDTDKVKEHVETLWTRAIQENLTAEQLTAEARRVQDELFDRRKRSTAIPGCVYWFTRENYQVQMEQAARNMAQAAKAKLGVAA